MINFNYKEMSDHRLQELLISINENISSYDSSIKSINESKDYHKSLIDMKKSCINEMVHRLDESDKLYESVGYDKSKIDSIVGKFQGFYETLTDTQKLKCESYKKSLDKVLEGLNKFLSKYIAKSYYNFGSIVNIDSKNPTLVSFNESLDKLDKRFDKLVTEALQASYPDCPTVNDSSEEFIDDTQDAPALDQPTVDDAAKVDFKVDTESSESEDKDEKVEESYNYFEDDPKSEFDDDELDAYSKGYSDAADEDDGLITISDELEDEE